MFCRLSAISAWDRSIKRGEKPKLYRVLGQTLGSNCKRPFLSPSFRCVFASFSDAVPTKTSVVIPIHRLPARFTWLVTAHCSVASFEDLGGSSLSLLWRTPIYIGPKFVSGDFAFRRSHKSQHVSGRDLPIPICPTAYGWLCNTEGFGQVFADGLALTFGELVDICF